MYYISTASATGRADRVRRDRRHGNAKRTLRSTGSPFATNQSYCAVEQRMPETIAASQRGSIQFLLACARAYCPPYHLSSGVMKKGIAHWLARPAALTSVFDPAESRPKRSIAAPKVARKLSAAAGDITNCSASGFFAIRPGERMNSNLTHMASCSSIVVIR
jgi:hypothetical protein